MPPSDLEIAFDVLLTIEDFPEWQTGYRFHPRRKWAVDVAWPDRRIAVELEGGIWTDGRHVRGAGFIADCRKYNALALFGWLLLRFTPGDLPSGVAVNELRAAFRVRAPIPQLTGGTANDHARTAPVRRPPADPRERAPRPRKTPAGRAPAAPA